MLFPELIVALKRSRYLFLEQIAETETNSLRPVIREGHVGDEVKVLNVGGTSLEGLRIDPGSDSFEIEWRSYVTYLVTNESYGKPAEAGEVFEGNCVRLYSNSRFLEYVKKATVAGDDYPGPLMHFSLICQDHIVDVVAAEEPTITAMRARIH